MMGNEKRVCDVPSHQYNALKQRKLSSYIHFRMKKVENHNVVSQISSCMDFALLLTGILVRWKKIRRKTTEDAKCMHK